VKILDKEFKTGKRHSGSRVVFKNKKKIRRKPKKKWGRNQRNGKRGRSKNGRALFKKCVGLAKTSIELRANETKGDIEPKTKADCSADPTPGFLVLNAVGERDKGNQQKGAFTAKNKNRTPTPERQSHNC